MIGDEDEDLDEDFAVLPPEESPPEIRVLVPTRPRLSPLALGVLFAVPYMDSPFPLSGGLPALPPRPEPFPPEFFPVARDPAPPSWPTKDTRAVSTDGAPSGKGLPKQRASKETRAKRREKRRARRKNRGGA